MDKNKRLAYDETFPKSYSLSYTNVHKYSILKIDTVIPNLKLDTINRKISLVFKSNIVFFIKKTVFTLKVLIIYN